MISIDYSMSPNLHRGEKEMNTRKNKRKEWEERVSDVSPREWYHYWYTLPLSLDMLLDVYTLQKNWKKKKKRTEQNTLLSSSYQLISYNHKTQDKCLDEMQYFIWAAFRHNTMFHTEKLHDKKKLHKSEIFTTTSLYIF